ncbi:MAG: hypothetical protein HYV18_06915 [Gammaproteobacteria bacterium]|nr:hypothetical protein [Gammaproteobacteria bacterium]
MTAANRSRLLALLEIAEKEGRHLLGTGQRLATEAIDGAWVQALEQRNR